MKKLSLTPAQITYKTQFKKNMYVPSHLYSSSCSSLQLFNTCPEIAPETPTSQSTLLHQRDQTGGQTLPRASSHATVHKITQN